jgi:hypothetical protein
MFRKYITSRALVPVLLCFQIIPLVAFPFETYSVKTQEWWLPLLLALLTTISLVQIILRRSIASWPWYLLSFSQGFNIISRLMMLLPHSTRSVDGGGQAMNGAYVAVAFATMLFSAFEIWYGELPEVRQKYAARSAKKAAA